MLNHVLKILSQLTFELYIPVGMDELDDLYGPGAIEQLMKKDGNVIMSTVILK